jgi:hypothetical protein
LGKQTRVFTVESLRKTVFFSFNSGTRARLPRPFNHFRNIDMRKLSAAALFSFLALASACSDSSGPNRTLAVTSGDNQSALAGTALGNPIILTGPGAMTFSVVAGGGSLSNTTGTANSDGTVTAPTWILGKSANAQQLQVTSGGQTKTINATVKTSYKMDVRFFGRTLTPAQQALFTNAADRIRAIVVGQLPLVNVAGTDVAKDCDATGVAPLTGSVDGILIFASIDSIDGKSKILAESGPCFVRTGNNNQLDWRTSIGIMKFDSADINSLAGSGNLQEVITHEMLHVVGFGALWDTTAANLLINYGPDVRYAGANGISGCRAIGGVTTCASSVPVEGTQGGDGTLNSHWRESTFNNELMTGFLNSGTNPLSVMTIRSLEDFGYTVNPAAADPFTIPGGSIRASFRIDDITQTSTPGTWERPLPRAPRSLPTMGFPLNSGSN